MAEDARIAEERLSSRERVQVGAADADPADADERIGVGRNGVGDLSKEELAGLLQDYLTHGFLPSLPYAMATDDTQATPAVDSQWRTSGIGAEAYAALADGMLASEVWSLLLDLFERRAARREPVDLVRQWERDRFTSPAIVDQRTMNELDRHLLAAAADFEALELSPLAPLGVCSVVGPTSQNKIVSALRGTEVVADPTNVLALECARRLREKPGQTIRLATCHRCVRAQPAPKGPGYSQHFRLFCMVTGGYEQKDQMFVTDSLVEHIVTHLAALDRLEQHGYAFPQRQLKVLATPERAALGDRIAAALEATQTSSQSPLAAITRDTLDHAYYHGLRFMISVRSPNDSDVPLIDGGAFDWLGKLTGNRKLVLVASGMGTQLAAMVFRTVAAAPLSR